MNRDDYKKRISRKCKHIDVIDLLPDLDYPKHGSDAFQRDVEILKHHYHNATLSDSFLNKSDENVSDLYKIFCHSHNLGVDWDQIDILLEDVDTIVLQMKFKYNRPRPKDFLINDSNKYELIREAKSPSYPSGHTAIAYFISGILSEIFPENTRDFETIAELAGLSRMENGVHYPSDVSYGRLVGELICSFYLNGAVPSEEKLIRKDYIDFSNHLRKLSKTYYPDLSEKEGVDRYVGDFGQFLHRTNEIENYYLKINDCLDAAYHTIAGYPVKHVTNNEHLASQIRGLVMAFKSTPIDDYLKIINIHKQFDKSILERGAPGSIRNFKHKSRNGDEFPEPSLIIDYLKKIDQSKDPFIKHIIFEWVHPFNDGNGRSGRIMLASDLNFDFKSLNSFIDENYIQRIVDFINSHDMHYLFKD